MKKDKAPRISKELITKSAIKLIVEGRRPSIRHIANYLSCSAPSIYYYFKSLEEINISICDHFFSDSLNDIKINDFWIQSYERFILENKEVFIHITKEFCDFGDSEPFRELQAWVNDGKYQVANIHGRMYLSFQLNQKLHR